MSIRRKFNRAQRRRTRRETPSSERRDYSLATVSLAGILGPEFASEPCPCPVCHYLEQIGAPMETLPDGTTVHKLTRQEHLEATALMALPHARC